MNNSGQQVVVIVNGREFLVELGDLNTTPVIAVVDGQTYEVVIREKPDEPTSEPGTAVSEPQVSVSPRTTPTETAISSIDNGTNVTAPMPGDIVEDLVQPGQEVSEGDSLCVLDAMKMNNIIRSPRKGRIASVEISRGQSVDHGTVLVTYE